MEGIKFCPFCWATPGIRSAQDSVGIMHRVECKCGRVGRWFETEEQVREDWNTRATDPLMEEMAQALERYLNNDGARGNYWVIEKEKARSECEKALQKYRAILG